MQEHETGNTVQMTGGTGAAKEEKCEVGGYTYTVEMQYTVDANEEQCHWYESIVESADTDEEATQ